MNTGLSYHEEQDFKMMAEMDEHCAGGHRVDGIIPKIEDYQYNGRTCDCGRLLYKVEGCSCSGNKELHAHPNQ